VRHLLLCGIIAGLLLLPRFADAQEAGGDTGPDAAQAVGEESTAQDAELSDTESLLDDAALETLVGPVALYPDTLLNQVLVASTVPLDVIKADRFLANNADADIEALKSGIAAEDWDESVAVLATAFPEVLQDMAEHIDWTEALGIAMLAQTDDVLDAIQSLREVAVDNGALADTEQQSVEITQDEVTQTQEIIIQPADPEFVYVPTYQPSEVFDSSLDDVVVGGLIAFSTVAIIDEIFDDDDHWSGYWGCRNCGGWGGRPIIRDPDIDIDVDGNVNIGNRLDFDRDNLNIDRDSINIDRDRITANRNDGEGALAGWKPDRNKRDAARDRIAEKRNPGGATKLPIKKPSTSDSVRDKIAARTSGGDKRPQIQRPGRDTAARQPGADRPALNRPNRDGPRVNRPQGNRPQTSRPQVNRPQALPAQNREVKKASLRAKSTSRPQSKIGKASSKKTPTVKKRAKPQSRIRYNVTKYSRVPASSGATGAQVARYLLDASGLQDVKVETTPGMLSDHYDPRSKTLRLSEGVHFAPTVAAIGVAAHEAGHAIQGAENYLPLEMRTYLVPFVQLSAQIAPWIFIAGLLLDLSNLTWAGAILFGTSTLFALLTLPVEINASKRALKQLVEHGIIKSEEELDGVRHVLRSAAWSYVGGAVSALGTWLFYLILLFGSGARQRS
jgi:Zn-dependent membrane protease YugP